MAHRSAMICQHVTLSGDAEWPKVADAVIEAAINSMPLCRCWMHAKRRHSRLHVSSYAKVRSTRTRHAWKAMSIRGSYRQMGRGKNVRLCGVQLGMVLAIPWAECEQPLCTEIHHCETSSRREESRQGSHSERGVLAAVRQVNHATQAWPVPSA